MFSCRRLTSTQFETTTQRHRIKIPQLLHLEHQQESELPAVLCNWHPGNAGLTSTASLTVHRLRSLCERHWHRLHLLTHLTGSANGVFLRRRLTTKGI